MTARRNDTGLRPRDTESLDVYGLPQPPDWTVDAACAEVGPELFFLPDVDGKGKGAGFDYRPAKRICAGCEVQTECLAYALEHDETGRNYVHGVFGGLTAAERRRLRASQHESGDAA